MAYEDYHKILRNDITVERYKDFWLPWLDMVQKFLEKEQIKMVYEWSLVNNRLEFMCVFIVDEQEFITISFCPWGKSEEWMRRTANTFIQRIIYEKKLKEGKIK